MRNVRKIPQLKNVPVLVRTALNVPVENGKVTNSFRLRQALPTIQYLQSKGARVILAGHIGEKGTETLEPVFQAMKQFLPRLEFCPVSIGKQAREAVRNLKAGDVLMLENLRRHRGETMNDPDFAAELASLADVFVEDSFDVCHRKHASVVGVPTFLPSYAGFLVENEVKELTKALKPKSPSLAIVGGAKFSTKEPVLVKLLSTYSNVFVGGALANDFIRAEGHSIGTSLTSDTPAQNIRKLLQLKKLLIPRDVIVAEQEETVTSGRAVTVDMVPSNESMLDVGPQTITALEPFIAEAKTILWNGPLGRYENGFTEATFALAKAIVKSKAHTILGGGDTVASLDAAGLAKRFSFVSTGGGAMLDFLAEGTLPGIEALR
ncbi:MAG: Phosphoglycerate kinase [Parcubacteria group bacterium]|nr:Phosphoglycerate kinase [Parcubacteria group bacterium]